MDMFKSPQPNIIESDEGFSIRVVGAGKYGIIYREGDLAIKVLSDAAIIPIGYIIYKNSIKEWAPPASGNIISEQTRKRIIDNLSRAFLFQGYQIEVDETHEFSDYWLHRLQNLNE